MIDFTEEAGGETTEVARRDWGTELKRAEAAFAIHQAEFNLMAERAEILVVKDEESQAQASEMGTQLQAFTKKVKAATDRILLDREIQEVLTLVSQVKGMAKNYLDPATKIKDALKIKIDAYLREARRRQEEAERIAREEARKLQERLNREAQERAFAEAKARAEAEATEKGVAIETVEVKVEPIPDVIIPEPILSPVKTTVRSKGGTGTAFQKKEWVFEVMDFWAVPDEFKMVNKVYIDFKIKLGVREIPGLRIFEEAKTQFRSR